jgi:OmpA-OmpF porin, OOP family
MKIGYRLAALLMLSAGSLAAPAHAQWMGLKQDTGLYIGAAAGQSRVKDLCNNLAPIGVTSCDEEDFAWKLSAGYQFHRNFAAEVGYVDWGKVSAGTPAGSVDLRSNGFEVLGVAIVPLSQSFSAYAKAGFVRWDADGGGVGDNGTEFTYGLGLAYDFTRNFTGRLEWQRYTDLVVDTFMAGVVYKFR